MLTDFYNVKNQEQLQQLNVKKTVRLIYIGLSKMSANV